MREDMKSMIADTFSQMLEKEDIDKITVTKLIGECHISRQTFYYHFRDIMDVLDWTFRRSTQALARRSLEAEDRVGALTAYVIFVRQNRIKLEKLLYSRRWVQIEAMLTESVMIYLDPPAGIKQVGPDRSHADRVCHDLSGGNGPGTGKGHSCQC